MRRKPSATKIIFALYCLILLWLVLFKLAFSFDEIRILQTDRHVNLIPFYYDDEVGRFHTKEVVLNLFVFIPMGLYLRMLAIPGKKAILFGFFCSFVLELFQYLFAIGASDITDVITNTLGTAGGICLYTLMRKLFPNKQSTDRFINIVATLALLLFGILAILLFGANR